MSKLTKTAICVSILLALFIVGIVLAPIDILGTKEQALRLEIEEMRDSRSDFASLTPTNRTREFGYHSSYKELGPVKLGEPKWTIELSNIQNYKLVKAALIPSIISRSGKLEAYGFPRQFRIIGSLRGESAVLFEWNDEYDPGMYPVFFDISKGNEAAPWEKLTLEVYRGREDAGTEYFALGEWMVFGNHPISIIDNRGLWMRVSLDSEQLRMHPYWSLKFLNDGRSALGPPLGTIIPDSDPDLIMQFDEQPKDGLKLYYEVRPKGKTGRVNLYPVTQKNRNINTNVGFPTAITVEASTQTGIDGFSKSDIVRTIKRTKVFAPNQDSFSIGIKRNDVRTVRITIDQLSEIDGIPSLAISEIEILQHGASVGRLIHSEGFSAEQEKLLERLSDNVIRNHHYLKEIDWIRQLSESGRIGRAISTKENELNDLIAYRKKVLKYTLTLLLIAVFSGLIGWIFTTKINAQRAEFKLREQLASDLHDDVGALLGCSMLAAGSISKSEINPLQRKQIRRVIDSTRQATQALRDIIWINDRAQSTVADLLEKTHDHLQIYSDYYQLNFNQEVPGGYLSRQLKGSHQRDIYYFIKESINNAHKHAKARKITLDFRLLTDMFRIVVQDDGVGFEFESDSIANAPTTGYGLRSLKRRASLLGGTVQISSNPKHGTRICLEFPSKTALT
ncbi:MAG: ATP-binding protein [Verrucomicrobiota bacterium]